MLGSLGYICPKISLFKRQSIPNNNDEYNVKIEVNEETEDIERPKSLDILSRNLIELLLNDKEDCNVIIEVKDGKRFNAHSNILRYRSTYFRRELENTVPNENNIRTIIKPDITEKIFDIILK